MKQIITSWEEYKLAFQNNNHLVTWDVESVYISLEYAKKNNWENRILNASMIIELMAKDEGLFHAVITEGKSSAYKIY